MLTWAGLLVVSAVLSGCTGAGSILSGKARSPQEAILITPLDGAKNIGPDGRMEVKVPDGRLESVKVTRIEDAQRQEVPGRIAHDGLSWTPRGKTDRLRLASKYSVDAVALDGAGNRSARHTSLVDAAAHTMEVRRDGRLLSTVPITAGYPGMDTYNGKMVVSEKYDVTRMDGRTVGFGGEYDISDVPHALRLTDSGTFVHGNYWSDEDVFGSANVSHGCVGLLDAEGGSSSTPAAWFFDRTLIGDVIEVVNSKDKQVAPDNGLGGWNLNWTRWKAGSALS